jgi:hypothetical protein
MNTTKQLLKESILHEIGKDQAIENKENEIINRNKLELKMKKLCTRYWYFSNKWYFDFENNNLNVY